MKQPINHGYDVEGTKFAIKEFLESLGIDTNQKNLELFFRYFLEFEQELVIKKR